MKTRTHLVAAAEPRLYHIGDVAALTGLTEHALRAWEQVDLLAPRRSPAGVRQYTEDDIARIRLIIRTLDSRRLSRRAVAALLRSGELRPDATDYSHDAIGWRRRRGPGSAERERASHQADGEIGRMQRLLESIARLSGAVASGRPLDEVLAAVCRETCQAFGVSDCVLWLVEPGEHDARPTTVMAVAAYGPHSRAAVAPATPLRVSLDDRRAVMARAIRTRRGIIVNAFDAEPGAHPELRALLPGAALLVAPLMRANGEPIGALALREAVEQERFDASDLELARLFATQATVAIETAQLHGEMRAARQEAEAERARWRATVENMPELVLTCDTSAGIRYVNAAFEKLSGRTVDPSLAYEAAVRYYGLSQPDRGDVYPPERLPLRRALTENQPVRGIELLQRTPDGGRRLISWDAAPVCGTDGELLGAVAVGHDITEEQRRGERERCLTAVTRTAAGIPSASKGSRAEQALRALVEHSEMTMIAATLYTYDAERRTLQRAGSYGVETAQAVPPTVPLDARHHWWEPVTQHAMYSSPGGSVPGWLTEIAPIIGGRRRRAWATAPLRSGTEFLGVLAVGLATPHEWDEAEREWFEACAGAVGLALANDRLYAEAQRHAEELEAVLDAVGEGISMVAADGGMLVRNAAAIEITGRRELTGKLSESGEIYALRDALTGKPVPLEESPLGRALRGERVRDVLLLMRDPQGRDRLTQSSSVPVRDAQGRVVAAVTVFREVEQGSEPRA